jgi:prepilin signal peptidase PulO-like enzyme (type II secretory pathway)
MIVLACIIGLFYFAVEVVISRHKTKKRAKTQEIFDEWRNTNKIIPFIPSLILAFWILLVKASLLLSLVF